VSLTGPSRTIIVEPVQEPDTEDAPVEPLVEPEPEPAPA
jgi:hypothetical protein